MEESADPHLPQLLRRKATQSRFSASLEVQPKCDTTLISLWFVSPDPIVARDILNALVQEFISWQVDKKIESSMSAKKQLEKQINAARIQLETAESNLNVFSRKAGIVSLDSKLNLVFSQLEEANKAYASVQTERINKEALYQQIKESGTSFPAIVESSLIQSFAATTSGLPPNTGKPMSPLKTIIQKSGI